jgi:hypothetical protein
MSRSARKQPDDEIKVLQRQVRLVVLLDAAENACLAPLPILRLHTLAYLSNVLAPVWDMLPLDGKVLKRHGGPFYPVLQRDLDRLVGTGVVIISGLAHVRDEEERWRLEGKYRLNRKFADRILNYLARFAEESRLRNFLYELAFALSALSNEDLDRAMTEDATYSDPIVDIGNVVDFAEWQQRNYSANAARYFDSLLPGGARATPGEKLHLYVRHLHTRIHGGR